MLNLNDVFGEKAASHPGAGDFNSPNATGADLSTHRPLKRRAGVSSLASASVSLGSAFPTAVSVPGGGVLQRRGSSHVCDVLRRGGSICSQEHFC